MSSDEKKNTQPPIRIFDIVVFEGPQDVTYLQKRCELLKDTVTTHIVCVTKENHLGIPNPDWFSEKDGQDPLNLRKVLEAHTSRILCLTMQVQVDPRNPNALAMTHDVLYKHINHKALDQIGVQPQDVLITGPIQGLPNPHSLEQFRNDVSCQARTLKLKSYIYDFEHTYDNTEEPACVLYRKRVLDSVAYNELFRFATLLPVENNAGWFCLYFYETDQEMIDTLKSNLDLLLRAHILRLKDHKYHMITGKEVKPVTEASSFPLQSGGVWKSALPSVQEEKSAPVVKA